MLEITSNDDVCGPVEYPCSTNHVEINDVYVCIHNGGGRGGSRLRLSYHLLIRTNMNIMECQSPRLIWRSSSRWYLFQSPSPPMRSGEVTLTKDNDLQLYINKLFIKTIAVIHSRAPDLIRLLPLIWKKSAFFSVLNSGSGHKGGEIRNIICGHRSHDLPWKLFPLSKIYWLYLVLFWFLFLFLNLLWILCSTIL